MISPDPQARRWTPSTASNPRSSTRIEVRPGVPSRPLSAPNAGPTATSAAARQAIPASPRTATRGHRSLTSAIHAGLRPVARGPRLERDRRAGRRREDRRPALPTLVGEVDLVRLSDAGLKVEASLEVTRMAAIHRRRCDDPRRDRRLVFRTLSRTLRAVRGVPAPRPGGPAAEIGKRLVCGSRPGARFRRQSKGPSRALRRCQRPNDRACGTARQAAVLRRRGAGSVGRARAGPAAPQPGSSPTSFRMASR